MKQKNVQLEALIDSKKEYLDHLFDLMTEPMVVTFQDMYQQCLQSHETRKKGILTSFQDALVSVASWNHHLIQEQYQKVVAHTGCKYIPELVRALISVQVKINLIANTQLASASNIKLRIPNAENFVHRCFVDVARAVWKRPYLLYHNVRSVEKQQNLLDLEKIIHQSIRTTIRGYVPMEQLIAQSHVMDIPVDDNDSSSEESEEQETDTESETSSSEDEASSSDTENDSLDDSESEVESIVEVVELPEEPAVDDIPEKPASLHESETEEEEELQNEVVDNHDIDITALQVENDPENVNDILSDGEEPVVVHEADIVQPVSFRKSVEVNEDESEEVNGELHVDKIEPQEELIAAPIELPPSAEDRAVPFHMMLMNRKIIHHRPPPSMVIKKKKKDAFF